MEIPKDLNRMNVSLGIKFGGLFGKTVIGCKRSVHECGLRRWDELMGVSFYLFNLFTAILFVFLRTVIFFFFFGRFTRHICLDRGAGLVG